MASRLQSEIQQRKPFSGLHEEAELSIIRTAAVIGDKLAQVFKPYGITGAQYNVLRILRGAGPGGLCRNDVRDRMLTRMPDMTRMLDRLEKVGMVTRDRDSADRRLVSTRITSAGLKVLDSLDGAIAGEHERQLGHLGENELKALIILLAKVRQRL